MTLYAFRTMVQTLTEDLFHAKAHFMLNSLFSLFIQQISVGCLPCTRHSPRYSEFSGEEDTSKAASALLVLMQRLELGHFSGSLSYI